MGCKGCECMRSQVYVAEPGYMLSRESVPKGAIVTQLAGAPTPDLVAFARQLARLKHGERVPLMYLLFGERHRAKTAVLHIDHRWCNLLHHALNTSAHAQTYHSAKHVRPCAIRIARPGPHFMHHNHLQGCSRKWQ